MKSPLEIVGVHDDYTFSVFMCLFQPKQAATQVFSAALDTLLQLCHCSNAADCFLHFSAVYNTPSNTTIPDTYLLLTPPVHAVGMQRANIKVRLDLTQSG